MSEQTVTNTSTPPKMLSGRSSQKSRFRNLSASNASLEFDKDQRSTYASIKSDTLDPSTNRYTESSRSYSVAGKLYKVAFRTVTTKENKSFNIVYMTFIHFGEKAAMFSEAYEKMYTTDSIFNKLCNMTQEQCDKYIKLELGKLSQPSKVGDEIQKDENGNIIWEDRLTSNGLVIPKIRLRVYDGQTINETTGVERGTNIRDLLWNSDECTHERKAEFEILKKSASKAQNGDGVHAFWREMVDEKLPTIGWEKLPKRTESNFTEINYINTVVSNELDAFNESIDASGGVTTTVPVSSEPVGSTQTADPDDLPF